MSEVAIFIYGLVAFGIVGAACALIIHGVLEERRDRGAQDARAAAVDAHRREASTSRSGVTIATERTNHEASR